MCVPCLLHAERSELPRSSPEAQGIASEALVGLIDALEREIDAVHGIMVLRHGQVVAEGWWAPYTANDPHALYSLSKSFTSTAVGFAVQEGRLSLDDPIVRFFPEEAPDEPSENLLQMRVRDLLMMSSGQHAEAIGGFDFWATDPGPSTRFLALPVAHKPGTHFVYNTPGSYMLASIVERVTGESMVDYLEPRLFAPLGIEHPIWDESSEGVALGGFGLYLHTEDIARFGQWLLQEGRWLDETLIDPGWISLATSRQTSNGSNPESEWDQGYGFQFWRCRHDLYRGDGAFGQFCIVMPQFDTVVALNSGTGDMGGVMRLLWEHLLPALGNDQSLPENPRELATLRDRLATLTLPPADGETEPPDEWNRVSSWQKWSEPFLGVEAHFLEILADGTCQLHLRSGAEEETLPIGLGKWIRSSSRILRQPHTRPGSAPTQAVALSGAWDDDGSFHLRICFHETPFVIDLWIRDGNRGASTIERRQNVSFEDTALPPLRATPEAP